MDEYFGDKVKSYGQTKVAERLLNPAIHRQLSALNIQNGRLLDLACGQGILYPIATELGFEYVGTDISPEQITVAKKLFTNGEFLVADARNYLDDRKFNVVTVSMALPLLPSKEDIRAVINTCKNRLEDGGKLLITVTHPCFDHYMRYGILGQKNIKTDFTGYFSSGTEFMIEHPMPNGSFTFDDFHWTLTDYFNLIRESDFIIDTIDECPPDEKFKTDEKFWKRRTDYPTYLVFVCSKEK